jgi:uncharacterized protein (DUF2267 family)
VPFKLQKEGEMNELTKLVAQKTGLSEEMAKTAVETVLDYLKQRLPAPIAAQVEGLLASDTGSAKGMAADLGKGLGGILNK